MITPLDEETLEKFDAGEVTDHEIKLMLIVKIQEIIDYCNAVGEWRTILANKATELLPKIQEQIDNLTREKKQ